MAGRQTSSTTPVLFPSGEDANPMNRRLPAEVVTRRRREPPKKVEEKVADEVQVDLRTALWLKPDARPKWLSKACKMAEEGRASCTDIYNIISTRKFITGLPSKIARKLRAVAHENLNLFSEKQQRHLRSDEWALNAFSGIVANDQDVDADDDDMDGKAPVDTAETAKPAPRPVPPVPVFSRPAQEPPRAASNAGVAAAAPGPPSWRGTDGPARWEAIEADEQARREALEKRFAEVERQRRMRREERERRMNFDGAFEAPIVKQRQPTKREQEEEVDKSMMLLERITNQKTKPERSRGRRDASRSRSVSAARDRKKDKDKDKKRRRRRSSSSSRPMRRQDFSEALRRRMAERDAELDSARVPVVDPDHAKRWLSK